MVTRGDGSQPVLDIGEGREETKVTPLPNVEADIVGPSVRQWRRAYGWSQEELARRMTALGHEMHQVTLGKLESGGRPIRVNEVVALATIFEISVEDLLEESPGPPFAETNYEEARGKLLEEQKEILARLAVTQERTEAAERSCTETAQLLRETQAELDRLRMHRERLEHQRAAIESQLSYIEEHSWRPADGQLRSVDVRRLWPQVLDRVLQGRTEYGTRPSIELVDVEDGVLTLEFGSSKNHAEFKRYDGDKALWKAINDVLGDGWGIRVSIGGRIQLPRKVD